MLKITPIFAAVLLLLTANAYAERVLSVNLEVYRNDSVRVNYVRFEDGSPTKYFQTGEYRLQMRDQTGKTLAELPLRLNYYVMSNPPVLMNSSMINLRLPRLEDTKYVVLYRNETQILFQPINPCNKNGICDTQFESYYTCPEDCPLDKNDGLCIKTADKTCDPDCEEGADPDCTTGIEWFQTALYVIAILVVVIVLSVYFYHELENRKVEKQRQEFIKWKKEHS